MIGYLKYTVTDSQVINWLELFETQGIVFDLLVIPTGLKTFIRNYRFRKRKIKETYKYLSGKKKQIFTVKSASLIGNIFVFMYLLFFLSKDFLLNKSIIIQTRNDSYFYSFKWLKKLYSKIYIIFDVRGSGIEEHSLYNDKSNSNYNLKRHKRLRAFLKLSEKIFCVSKKLKEYLLNENSDLKEDKISVIPGCADENSFYFDKDARQLIRTQLNLSGKIILVYSGGLDKKWQIPDTLFCFVRNLQDKFPQIYFLCLTPDIEIALKNAKIFNISSDNIWIKYVNYQKLNDYLSAADFGLLLRKNDIINNVASPTKFAEYLMSGLPVIISKGIGDFSDFVKRENIGIVIYDPIDENSKLHDKKFIKIRYNRDEISKIGKYHFSKQRYLTKILSNYENLIKLK